MKRFAAAIVLSLFVVIASVPATAYACLYYSGQKVRVVWKGKWYNATILNVRKGKPCLYRIHYDGWSSSWDETVGPHRIKKR